MHTTRATFEGGRMVLPVETEEKLKRRALSVCQEHLRKVVEISRKVPQMFDCFIKSDKETAQRLFVEIRKSQEEVDSARRAVSQELAEIGAILMSREDFLRFTNLSSEIADFSEGVAFWLLQIIQREWKVSSDIKKDLLKLSEDVLDTILKLRETAITLSYGSARTLEKARDVEMAERVVDETYREVELKIINANVTIPVVFLLHDIIKLLEDSADKAEDAADAARILSFAI
jgi:predicted phosphate transport protein (TIGR00153 family)